MMTEKEKLIDRLFNDPKRKLLNFHITRGPEPCTAEELCAAINHALDHAQIFEGSVDFDDDCPKSDIRALFGSKS